MRNKKMVKSLKLSVAIFHGSFFRRVFFCTTLLFFLALPTFSPNTNICLAATNISITEQYYQWLEMGDAAIPELKEALKSDNWRMRTHALLAMGKTGDNSLTPLLIDHLQNDNNQAVKNCAVLALGYLKESSAVQILLDLLNQYQESVKGKILPEQRVIVKSLGMIGDSAAVKPLFDLLVSTRNDQLRLEITEALITINDPVVSEMILTHKPDPKRFPYTHAAKILGEIPVDGAEDYLIKSLGNNRMTIKNSAVISLGKIKSQKSVPLLLALLKEDDSHLQSNISKSLINIDAPSAVIPLCNLLSNPNSKTAMISGRILANMSNNNIAEEVYIRFKKDHSINAPAAVVLGHKQYKKSIPEIRLRLRDEKETGQEEMTEALGLLEDRESIPLLMKIATRKSRNGSFGAIWALGHLKSEEAIPLLLKIIKKQDRHLTGPAVFALGEIGDPATVKPLINLYYESGFQYQMQVSLALAQIGGPEVAEILKTNMESDNPKRQKMAGYMLLKSRDTSLVPYAISLLRHPDASIRRYAMGGLKNITGQNFETTPEWEVWYQKQNQ